MNAALLCLCACLVTVVVAASTVHVHDRQLYVDNEVFTVKAVGYAPVPIGVDATVTIPYGDYFTSAYSLIWKRDIPIIKSLGANTIKLWGWNINDDHTEFLDACVANGLWVIPTFFIAPGTYSNLADPAVQKQIMSDFSAFLGGIKSHPSVLFYNLGSDLNADWNYGYELDSLFQVLNSLAAHLKIIEIANPKPVSTALNDQNSINIIKQYEATTLLDLWSLNIYRGCGFGLLFQEFKTASNLPIFLSEFGIDAYDDTVFAVDEKAQGNCFAIMWNAISTNSTLCIGGAVTEYVDEFWKSKLAQRDARHPTCPNYDPKIHANCGYPNDQFPDKYANQAYFGIVDPEFAPRDAYKQLQSLWTAM